MSADIPSLFGNRPVVVIGASPGGFGKILHKTPGFRFCVHWAGGRLMLSRAHQVIDENGGITDKATRKLAGGFLPGFAGFVGVKLIFQIIL